GFQSQEGCIIAQESVPDTGINYLAYLTVVFEYFDVIKYPTFISISIAFKRFHKWNRRFNDVPIVQVIDRYISGFLPVAIVITGLSNIIVGRIFSLIRQLGLVDYKSIDR